MFYHENKSTLRACDNDMSALLLQLVPVTAVAYDKPNILTNPSVAEFFLKFFLSRLCRYTIPGVRTEFFYIYIYIRAWCRHKIRVIRFIRGPR